MWDNPELLQQAKCNEKNIEKTIDPLNTNNAISRDSLTLNVNDKRFFMAQLRCIARYCYRISSFYFFPREIFLTAT